jgi:hypothetical protein
VNIGWDTCTKKPQKEGGLICFVINFRKILQRKVCTPISGYLYTLLTAYVHFDTFCIDSLLIYLKKIKNNSVLVTVLNVDIRAKRAILPWGYMRCSESVPKIDTDFDIYTEEA